MLSLRIGFQRQHFLIGFCGPTGSGLIYSPAIGGEYQVVGLVVRPEAIANLHLTAEPGSGFLAMLYLDLHSRGIYWNVRCFHYSFEGLQVGDSRWCTPLFGYCQLSLIHELDVADQHFFGTRSGLATAGKYQQ
jgi:hypothetical protein